MMLGVVSGEIYSTIQHRTYEKHKLLIVDLTDAAWNLTGKYLIALDQVGAGAGERVLINDEGNGARQVLNDENAPVRSVIVGIVDEARIEAVI